MTRIGINGFGRIGRQVLKAMIERYPKTLQVAAVNDLFDVETRGIPVHTVNQISVIMRFLEIQWQHLEDDILRDT